jgi:hypothetical protein
VAVEAVDTTLEQQFWLQCILALLEVQVVVLGLLLLLLVVLLLLVKVTQVELLVLVQVTANHQAVAVALVAVEEMVKPTTVFAAMVEQDLQTLFQELL